MEVWAGFSAVKVRDWLRILIRVMDLFNPLMNDQPEADEPAHEPVLRLHRHRVTRY